jgi:hypothetical protein
MAKSFFDEEQGGSRRRSSMRHKGTTPGPDTSATKPGMTRSEIFATGKAIGGGLKAASIFMQAGVQKQNIDAKITSLHAQLAEREARHGTNLRLLRNQARKAVSTQKEAFIKGGVKLEGSAIDVVNDTLMDLLGAELNKQREQDFISEQTAIEEANLRNQRAQVDQAAFLNATSSILGGLA